MEELTVPLTGITVESYTTSEGVVVVDRVVFETPNAPNDQITFKPRNQEVVSTELAGVEVTETNTVRYEPGGFAADFENIKDAQQALKDGKQVKLTAPVSKFDQREQEDVDGSDVYYYIDKSHGDDIELEIEPEPDTQPESADTE